MYKIYSTFKRTILLSLAFLTIAFNPVSAVLDQDLYLEKSFMEIPTELEEELSKKIDFSFNQVDLSEILLLMSKIGDFNIVFPKELDRKISIQIKQESIKNVLEDFSFLYDYKFEIKNNSVVFKNKNLNEHFQLIPLKYKSAALVLNILKDQDFNGVKLNKDPSLNNILAVGNIETIRAIEDFVKSVDIAPKQRIFLPEFLNYKAIQRFLRYNLDEKADIEATRIEQNYILLSGQETIVKYAYDRLEEIDRPIADQAFSIEVYSMDKTLEAQIQRLEPDYKRKFLFRVDADEIIFDSFSLINSQNIKASNDLKLLAFDLKFEFSRDILDLETIDLHFDNKETFFKKSSDYVIYYLPKKELKKKFLVKKALDINQNLDIIFVIKTISNEEFEENFGLIKKEL
jgi:hypothetical protein